MKLDYRFGAVALAGLLSSGCAFAALKAGPGDTPFWISLQSRQQIDLQVARLLADHAAFIALRTPDDGGEVSQAHALVAKLKGAAPQTPVLMYGRTSRDLGANRGTAAGTASMDWLSQDSTMQVHLPNGRAVSGYGDVTNPAYRSKIASILASSAERGGFDGVALDFSIRTPRYRWGPLMRLCSTDATFCAHYGDGMDATFDAVRNALGGRAILYNGLWNFGPGSVADQQALLGHADAAAIEYFGADPKQPQPNFSHDILPFLQAMSQTPADKKILAFGRGSWTYTDYAEDYARERYMYSAYLLGARPNTYFKYHATFQVDTPSGRTGGLAVYSDWSANLGAPSQAYSVASGLYSRRFAHGLVIVAPDDGSGGGYDLAHAMYSPEGDKYEGHVKLRPGEGLLLLDSKSPRVDDQRLLDLALLADWPNATKTGEGPATEIGLRAGAPIGSDDMLLDAIRTQHPHDTLQMAVQAAGPTTRMQLVAEVDDPSHRQEYAILDIKSHGASNGGAQAMGFRAATSSKPAMSVIEGPELTPGAWQSLDLSGHALFANSGLTFRRWDYVRFIGAMKLKAVKLAN